MKGINNIVKFKWGLDDWIALVLIGFGVFIPGINSLINSFPAFQTLFSDIRGELIGIGIGVILINNAAEVMQYQDEQKRKAISKLESPDNSIAKEAFENARKEGWLYDGTISGYSYQGANWGGLDLSGAKLSSTDLNKVNLKNTLLVDADLSGSSLKYADLGGTTLWNTDLRGADLSQANFHGANIKNIKKDENTKLPDYVNLDDDLWFEYDDSSNNSSEEENEKEDEN